MATTGPSQTTSDKGSNKVRKGTAPRIHRDNDTDDARNRATHQESRDRNEREHFHAADTPDISQSSGRTQIRENGQDERLSDRNISNSHYSHYNDENRAYQSFSGAGGNRSAGHRYEQMGHDANRRPNDGYGDPINEVDRRYLNHERNGNGRDDDRGHYDDNRAERDRYELNDRQNGWQANVRVDNRSYDRRHPDDRHFQNNWRDPQWRETASYSDRHQWRPNDDGRNEQRNGSEYDRDRGSYGNSRFRDDDYGYRSSRPDTDQYRGDYDRGNERNDPLQPRGYTANSEQDYNDRNPSHERDRNNRHR